jgi:hypothetical protein
LPFLFIAVHLVDMDILLEAVDYYSPLLPHIPALPRANASNRVENAQIFRNNDILANCAGRIDHFYPNYLQLHSIHYPTL